MVFSELYSGLDTTSIGAMHRMGVEASSIDENNRKKNILFTPSKRQVALSNILVALEENRILAVFHKGKDGMQINVM